MLSEGLPYQWCHAVDIEHSQSKYVHDTNNHCSGVVRGREGEREGEGGERGRGREEGGRGGKRGGGGKERSAWGK